jgi:hypothetical protein
MLVDEEFFDDVVRTDDRGVRHFEEEIAVRRQHGAVRMQCFARALQMFQRVAGIDDVETLGLEARVFQARVQPGEAGLAGPGADDALIRLDADDLRFRVGGLELEREGAAVRADVEDAEGTLLIQERLQRREIGLCAKALAVTQIAPIGAGGDGRLPTLRAIGARQALQ